MPRFPPDDDLATRPEFRMPEQPAPTLPGQALPEPLPAMPELGDQGVWTAGAIVANRYRLIKSLGQGGMGEVVLAEDLFLRRKVALKTLRRELAEDPGALNTFRQEVAMAHAVTHPGLARTFDMGESAGIMYLTMEYLEGESLASRIKREGPLPVAEVRRIAFEVAAAVYAAHQAGVIHRDLKPSNIQLAPHRGVVVLDFGLAAAVDSPAGRPVSAGLSELIRPSSSSAGTPAYMAPEQWRGEPQGVATDIYAFGVILFESLTGRPPFLGKDYQAMRCAHLEQEPPSLRSLRPDVPANLEHLVAACLAKAPAQRPASMQEVARQLVGRSFVRPLITLGLACGAWLAVLAAGAIIWWTAKGLLLREIRPAVQHLAEIAALRIDGRQLAQVRQPADMETQPFRDVHSVLERLRRDNPSVLYAYTLRKLPAEHAWESVVDVDPRDVDRNHNGVIEDGERGSPPGAPFDDAPFPQLARVFREQRPMADENFISDPWGLTLSGYAPVSAPDGESYVVGIDVGNEPLVRLRNTLFAVVLLLGLILAGLIVGLRFRRAEVLDGFGKRSLIE